MAWRKSRRASSPFQTRICARPSCVRRTQMQVSSSFVNALSSYLQTPMCARGGTMPVSSRSVSVFQLRCLRGHQCAERLDASFHKSCNSSCPTSAGIYFHSWFWPWSLEGPSAGPRNGAVLGCQIQRTPWRHLQSGVALASSKNGVEKRNQNRARNRIYFLEILRTENEYIFSQ